MYTALYRKKRPRTFKEIVGQAHIKKALISQLVAGQVSHAYLFCGTRGTGKTSAAKIFARAVNCLAPVDGEPCNTCELCENILAERCLDVAEIDAASNNGVENIRDLRDEVKYLPNMGRYKVYIVDEVHMLSTSAFNALLKTLEEPPPHVIFILATTDPQKIPATILSRCQRYDFRRIPAEQMTEALRGYLTSEGLAFEDDALDYIAYHSDGAMRDALSLLDQCLSVGADGLTLEKIRDLLGAVDRARLFEFTDALVQQNVNGVIEIIATAMNDGRDVSQFAADLVRHFRDVLVAGLTGGDEFSAVAAEKFKEQAKSVPREMLMRYISAFSEVQREMRFAPHKRTAFEVCALKMCAPPESPVAIPIPPVSQVSVATPVPSAPQVSVATPIPSAPQASVVISVPSEPQVSAATPVPSAPQVSVATPIPSVSVPQASTKPSKSPQNSFSNITANWASLCKKLPPSTRSMCTKCTVEPIDGMLKIYCGDETTRQLLLGKQEAIQKTVSEYFSLSPPPNLAIEVREAYNKQTQTNTPSQSGGKAPPKTIEKPTLPPEAPPPADDWASFGQEVLGGEEW